MASFYISCPETGYSRVMFSAFLEREKGNTDIPGQTRGLYQCYSAPNTEASEPHVTSVPVRWSVVETS